MNLRHLKRSVCLQHDSSDCGAACLLSVVTYFGGESSIDTIRELSGTNEQGTTMLGLYDAAEALGLKAVSYTADIEYLKAVSTPHILHFTTKEGLLHYIVIWGYENGIFTGMDPSQGSVRYEEKELNERWQSHVCMALSMAERFRVSNEIKRDKRRWLKELILCDIQVYTASVLLGLITAVLGLSTSIFSQKLIDSWLPEGDLKRISIAMVFLLILLIFRILISSARGYIMNRQGRDLNVRLMKDFFKKVLRRSLSFFEYRKTGDIVSRMSDVSRIKGVICDIVGGNLVLNVLLIVGVLMALFYYSPGLSLFMLLLLPMLWIIMSRFNKRIKGGQYSVMSSSAAVESNFITSIQGIRIFKVFDRLAKIYNNGMVLYKRNQEESFELGNLSIRLSMCYGFLSLIVVIAIMWYGAYQVILGILTTGGYMAVISLVSMSMPAIVELSYVPISLNEAKVAFDRIYDISRQDSSIEDSVSVKYNDPVHSLTISKVSFRYTHSTPVLKNISNVFVKGVFYGMVGESGVGKSTLCKLLEGTYVPMSGTIKINDNIDFNRLSESNKAEMLGIVTQDTPVINGTLLENICLYIDDADSANRAMTMCNSFGFGIFVARFANGYNTLLGDSGVRLSGGEKQMLALMRIIVKNPEVIILDEPTASMDREMEIFTMNLLSRIKVDSIVIMVTHKYGLLKKYADKICVLSHTGLSCGTHSELMLSSNIYSQYWCDIV